MNCMYEGNGYTLDIVKVRGGWAQKATIVSTGESRYRTYHYKRDAEAGLYEWKSYRGSGEFMRDFHHNFWFAENEVHLI